MGHLGSAKAPIEISKKKAEERLEAAQQRLLRLRLLLGGQIGEKTIGPPLCILFEGWDASGKGGAIKRLVSMIDPRHVRVSQFAAPTYDEKRHHFLQRFWQVLPGNGGMTVLDRSWYGRVLVERVEGFATTNQWKRAYDEISEFERTLTAEGMILIKFWMHVSADEQLRRFEDRANDPLRSWKLTDEDWRNRKKRAEYEDAIEDMLAKTDKPRARWTVVPGDSKPYARLAVAEQVCKVLETRLEKRGYDLHAADQPGNPHP
jgi:polyphosphate kinase 2 (PPK2 family)